MWVYGFMIFTLFKLTHESLDDPTKHTLTPHTLSLTYSLT